MKTIGVLEKIEKMHRIKKIIFFLTCIKCLQLVLKHLLKTKFTTLQIKKKGYRYQIKI